jgi:hypothetical protein
MGMILTYCSHISFNFSSYVPTCFWVYVLMFVLEGELKSFAHACDFVCVNSELDDSFTMTHECNMVVYHECRLHWECRYVSNES